MITGNKGEPGGRTVKHVAPVSTGGVLLVQGIPSKLTVFIALINALRRISCCEVFKKSNQLFIHSSHIT